MDGVQLYQQELEQATLEKQTTEYVGARTDSFVQVRSDVHWGWLVAGGICLMIGVVVATIVLAKITPVGQMIVKAWNGLKAMFGAIIAWKPKGK